MTEFPPRNTTKRVYFSLHIFIKRHVRVRFARTGTTIAIVTGPRILNLSSREISSFSCFNLVLTSLQCLQCFSCSNSLCIVSGTPPTPTSGALLNTFKISNRYEQMRVWWLEIDCQLCNREQVEWNRGIHYGFFVFTLTSQRSKRYFF